MLTPLAVTFAINVITQFIKKYLLPRFGETGVHALVFILCLFAALGFFFKGQFPQIEALVVVALQIFCMAVTLYEVVLKRIASVFSKEV